MSAAASGRAGATWLALLRGINVVGKNKVPMKALASALERAGFRSVRTYIQSGNVVFHSSRRDPGSLAKQIERLVERNFACAPRVLLISRAELATAIRGNPFPDADRNHKSLHLYFLASHPKSPDIEALARLDAGREAFALQGKVCYLWTPDGFADSALRSRIERCLGVPATARNWRTVNELLKLLG
ncbi:MAG TPA: DUF1697 domain-containing protein [Steroidobacteraceae bacterium]|jgi:uncharacterized protein (DUF1697 family)|nr:DUF1697 domain-containing protein [Steroidobacteraceae bacterium]